MNRRFAAAALLAWLACGSGAPLRSAPSASGADILLDPNIAKASAEADAAAGQDEPSGGPPTTYERALLNYKSGKYDAARLLIEQADQEKPGDVPVEMLKVRILTELHDFTGARQALNSLYDRSDLTPAYAAALQLTAGDLNLQQRRFDAATKAYQTYLAGQPNDADAKLRLIYARLGEGDLVTAGRLESELKPLDPTTPAYYFAHAALARFGVGGGNEQDDIQQARTLYGITVTNRYLKTYLEMFAANKGSIDSQLNPPAAGTTSAPAGPGH